MGITQKLEESPIETIEISEEELNNNEIVKISEEELNTTLE